MYSYYLIIAWIVLVALKPTRKFTLAMTPWILFGCSYDVMRLLPNYAVTPSIDTTGIMELERQLFGIATGEGVLIPGEYFHQHHAVWQDLLAGFFYLCWVPVPLGYAFWLFFKGKGRECAKFSIAFLWINLFGFSFYYVHPTAPPWYTMQYGAEIIHNTPGSVADLCRFDSLMPFPVFANIYSGNSNVFAAIPSLHSAYVLVAAIYAWWNRHKMASACFFAITVGIWWTAVYSCHHYIIDVLLGILTAIVGVAILEGIFCRIPVIQRALEKYVALLGCRQNDNTQTK